MGILQWGVRGKLAASFGLMALLIIFLSGISIVDTGNSKDQFHDFVTGIDARAHLAQQMRAAVDRRAVAARNIVLATKASDRDAEKMAVTKAHDDVQRYLSQLRQETQKPDIPASVKALVSDLETIEKAYGPVALRIVELALADKRDEAIAMINDECRPLLAALIGKTDAYQRATDERSLQLVEDSEAAFEAHRRFLIGLALLATAVAVLSGVTITRSVLLALGAEPDVLSKAASQVAGGDLSRIAGADAAPASSVLASLGAMQRNLASIVDKVRGATVSISAGTSQIAIGNSNLSERTEEQATALQQTAATMDEFTSTIRNSAENAKAANQLAINASAVATNGGQVVSQVVHTMQEINDSSRKISEIIGVIDGIAFQTNILALNAAVEAARAGEQGRGFAVVAAEVRNLAQRSAGAAKEIKTLIHESVEKVSRGTDLVDKAGQTMADVVVAIQRVSDVVAEISSASAEQSSGVSQIGQAVNQMDQATQQNAALVEESAAAAHSLESQARLLADAVHAFKLEDAAHRSLDRIAVGG